MSAETFEYAEPSTDVGVEALLEYTTSQSLVTRHSGLPMYWNGPTPLSATAFRSKPIQLCVKRLLDAIGSAIGIVLLGPLLLVVAILIKASSPGPVLFSQPREGLNGNLFEVFKFRSMTLDQCDHSGVKQTVVNDARVTAIGKFIRRTSIDELPQLFNVLRGDMSLVGPRPHVAGMQAADVDYKVLVPHYDMRFIMRPGLTGWAQANGLRGPTFDAGKARARIDHDLAYIQNFSLWLDIKILFVTVRNEFMTGTGH